MSIHKERRLLEQDGEKLNKWISLDDFTTKWYENDMGSEEHPTHPSTIRAFWEDYLTSWDPSVEDYLQSR